MTMGDDPWILVYHHQLLRQHCMKKSWRFAEAFLVAGSSVRVSSVAVKS